MSLGNPLGDPLGNPLGLARNSAPKQAIRGEVSWIVPGTYQWIVPFGVKSICAVSIGGGGGYYNSSPYYAGNGGSLGWGNDILVSPGQVITVVVGAAGAYGGLGVAAKGGDSYVSLDGGLSRAVNAPGGNIRNDPNSAPTPNGKVGGLGGSNTQFVGGGGAGGYTTVGGVGGSSNGSAGDSSDGGGGGGYNSYAGGGIGGGSWLYGANPSSGKGAGNGPASSTGQGLCDGYPPSRPGTNFGLFFGGGMAYQGLGCAGAVRILWGAGRAFPSTDVGLPV